MSLFALRREYQRTYDRIFEEFSNDSGLQTEQGSQKAVSSDMASQDEFIQHDVRAWGIFLDSKRTE